MLKKVKVFISWRYFVMIFPLAYLFLTCFAAYKLYYNDLPQQHAKDTLGHFRKTGDLLHGSKPVLPLKNLQKNQLNISTPVVEIWGKAAIGEYLWKHVLGGELTQKENSWYSYGSLSINNVSFIFRSGPGVVPNTVPQNVQYLILVINGRSETKINVAKVWLDSLYSYEYLKKVILVVLGDEKCENDWLLPYMKSHGGKVNAAFLVYDSPLIDNQEFFQWPLGVATLIYAAPQWNEVVRYGTVEICRRKKNKHVGYDWVGYRGFPNLQEDDVDLLSSRPYLCNFLGTIYKNSSRETLLEVIKLKNLEDECFILGRQKWSPLETKFTLRRYISSIHKSDLTLNPVGMNTECYRIYESLSLGSIPVVEDIVTPGSCDSSYYLSPLRILKDHGAPLIYIKNWSDLPVILSEERMLTLEEKVQRRITATQWYKNFKNTMRDILVGVIDKVCFSH